MRLEKLWNALKHLFVYNWQQVIVSHVGSHCSRVKLWDLNGFGVILWLFSAVRSSSSAFFLPQQQVCCVTDADEQQTDIRHGRKQHRWASAYHLRTDLKSAKVSTNRASQRPQTCISLNKVSVYRHFQSRPVLKEGQDTNHNSECEMDNSK